MKSARRRLCVMMANAGSLSSQNCQKSLGGLGVKVHDLHREVQDFPGSGELPAEISALVDGLRQQHDRSVNVGKVRNTSE